MTARARLALQGAIATLAAASALSAVFVDERWFIPVAGAVLLVAATNELCRRTPLPAALGPVLAAVAVLCYVTVLDTSQTAYAKVIPTRDSLSALADLARGGFTDIRKLAAPVPTHSGLVLLAIVGIAAVELVVDLVAVTLRRAAIAGLPLLAVFALCTSVAKGGVGWLPFGIGTAGYLWLLLVDSRDRISRWGRSVGSATTSAAQITWADTDMSPSPLSILGRRIGGTAIAVAVVLPVLVPGLHGGLPKHGPGGSGSGRGSSQVVTVNPIVNIRAQLNSPIAAKLMRVVSTDFSPSYLRLTSLDLFDGTTFSPSDLKQPSSANVKNGLKGAPQVTGTTVQTKVSVDSLDVHWLPLPTQAESVSVDGDWRYDADSNTVFSSRADTHNLSYTTSSVRFEPTAAELQSAGLPAVGEVPDRYTALPSDIDDRVVALAQAITARATTPFAKALAIQTFLTGPAFHYDINVAATDSSDALAQFLLVTRRGFCQQFAASMAVLARIVGIPSRVAVGFTHGTLQSDGTWLVTSHDAHAWPELYLAGFGWLPFEPTPRTDGQAITPAYTRIGANNQPNDSRSAGNDSRQKNAPNLTPADRKQLERETPPVPPAKPAVTHHGRSLWWWLPLLVLVVVIAVLPATARVVQRRRRWRGEYGAAHWAHQGWAELRASAVDARVGWLDGVTPRATARLLRAETGLDAGALAALTRLVRAEERARYAPTAGELDRDDVRRDVATVSRAMTARLTRMQRVGAVVWPRSTVAAARRLTSAFADALDLIDVAGLRVRRWLRRRVVRPA